MHCRFYLVVNTFLFIAKSLLEYDIISQETISQSDSNKEGDIHSDQKEYDLVSSVQSNEFDIVSNKSSEDKKSDDQVKFDLAEDLETSGSEKAAKNNATVDHEQIKKDLKSVLSGEDDDFGENLNDSINKCKKLSTCYLCIKVNNNKNVMTCHMDRKMKNKLRSEFWFQIYDNW